jgi:hypothetical protein
MAQKSMPWLLVNSVGRASQQEARVEEQPAQDEAPEAEGVQPGEGDVTRPDLERNEVVRERGQHRHDHQEDHGRAVHREDLVVGLLVDDLAVRLGQLGPDDQRLQSADGEERHGADAVHDPDPLVVDRGEPRPPALGRDRTGEDAEGLGLRLCAGGQLEDRSLLGDGHLHALRSATHSSELR